MLLRGQEKAHDAEHRDGEDDHRDQDFEKRKPALTHTQYSTIPGESGYSKGRRPAESNPFMQL